MGLLLIAATKLSKLLLFINKKKAVYVCADLTWQSIFLVIFISISNN